MTHVHNMSQHLCIWRTCTCFCRLQREINTEKLDFLKSGPSMLKHLTPQSQKELVPYMEKEVNALKNMMHYMIVFCFS